MSMHDRIQPPLAEVKPVTVAHHGVELVDPYAWLRDPGYPAIADTGVLAYLEAENAHANAILEPWRAEIDAMFAELKGRLKEDDSSVPSRDGAYEYWWKFEPGAQYRRWLRQPVAGGAEELLLDEVARAEGRGYYAVRDMDIAPNDRLLAWSEDDDGSERFTIHIRDLATGHEVGRTVTNTSGTVVWTAHSDGFIYVELTPEHRPFRVRLHRLDAAEGAEDPILYEEADPSFFVGIGRTQGRGFLTIGCGDHVTTETRIIPTDDPLAVPVVVAPRRAGHRYQLDEAGGDFFILTNDVHADFRVVSAPRHDPAEANWTEVMGPGEGRYYKGLATFKRFLAVQGRENGLDRIWLRDQATGEVHAIRFPEEVASVGLGGNAEADPDRIRIGYQSMITPGTVYDYDPVGRVLETRKVQEIPSGYDKARWRTERLMAKAPDGAEVPMSIVYPADHPRDGSRPLYLYGYGAYGSGLPPYFSTARLSLLERGFAFAIAHIRGGDELGHHWYEAGKGSSRMNTFTDFIACAEELVAQGFGSPGRIAISGGSAGGTLVGVALNLRPDLWGAAAAHVPFVDVLNTMLDSSLPLTPIEWPEWGNPITDRAAFDTILDYSPYDNVTAQDYPPMLVTAGLNDPRVTYWEPAKWVARLRARKTDSNPILFKTHMGAGHGGKSGRYEALEELAEEYVFLVKVLG